MVVFNHTAESITGLPPLLEELGYHGKYGVQLFFVMSAYTLSLSMSRRSDEARPQLNYFIRRYFRIMPLYYFGMALYFILFLCKYQLGFQTHLPHLDYNTKTVAANLTFTHGLFPQTFSALVLGGWSIGTEMAFYLLFPLLFRAYFKIKKPVYFLILPPLAAIVISLFFRVLPHVFPPLSAHNFEFYYCSVLNQLPVFATGISLFFYNSRAGARQPSLLLSLLGFVLATGFIIGLKLLNINDVTLPSFFAALSFVFLFYLVKNAAALNSKWLQKTGQLSFSVYVLHFLFAVALSSYLNIWLSSYLPPVALLAIAFLVSMVLSMAVSQLTFSGIEQPGISLGKKLIFKFNSRVYE